MAILREMSIKRNIQSDSYNAREIFACNFWTNDRKKMKLASEELHVHADSVHEKFTVASWVGVEWRSF